MPQTIRSLRPVLLADAATCVGAGLVMTLGASVLAPLLSLPSALLLWAGASLFPIAAFMAWVGWRAPGSAPLAAVVVAGNVAWVAGSLGVMAGVAGEPSALGLAFVGAQALAVAVLAAIELRGLIALQSTTRLTRPA